MSSHPCENDIMRWPRFILTLSFLAERTERIEHSTLLFPSRYQNDIRDLLAGRDPNTRHLDWNLVFGGEDGNGGGAPFPAVELIFSGIKLQTLRNSQNPAP
jgi:hypothetical protein